jgi:hypothetical protein
VSNVLIGIIGVVLLIGLALAGALFLGDRFSQADNEAEATRFMQEGSQISQAFELHGLNEGGYPSGNAAAKLQALVDKGYLKSVPVGGESAWAIDDSKGAALTYIGDTSASANICQAARRKAGFTDAVKTCDAADLAANDPCCTAP